MRATYTRRLGTETFLGFYDVHADVLSGIFRKRKRLREVSEAFRRLRACYPHRRLYVILDNLHLVHDHPRFLWLNLIEPHFGVLHRATVAGSDDREHVEGQAIAVLLPYTRQRFRKAITYGRSDQSRVRDACGSS